MKQLAIILFLLLTALFFLMGSNYVESQLNLPKNVFNGNSEDCTPERLRCKVLASVYKEAANLTYDIRRRSIDKQVLPVVRIYMSDGAVNKLDQKRKSVLKKNRPIHISEEGDWVKGTAIVEYGDKKEKSKITMRLKGDWGDHMEHPKKLSFRIKTRGGGYLFGLKTFSIQHPVTRNFSNEPMILNHMRRHDILAPRFKFIDVHINDHSIGVMAMEEHFKKEMLESQDRRDGPILALDEGDLWNQWDVNFNGPNPSNGFRTNFYPYRDSLIKNYRSAKFERGTIPTNNELRAMALLRDFYDGNIGVNEVYNYELLSKYWVLTNVWGGCHAAAWHNRRHYFNPITGLFEPISFDNNPYFNKKFRYCVLDEVRFALRDPNFIKKVIDFSSELLEELRSDEFQKQYTSDTQKYEKILSIETFENVPEIINVNMLIENLSSFLAKFEDGLINPPRKGSLRRGSGDHHVRDRVKQNEGPFPLHLTAYYFPRSTEKGLIEFRNLTPNDIEITRVYYAGKKKVKETFSVEPFLLASANSGHGTNKQDMFVPENLLANKGDIFVDYLYKGQKHKKIVNVQFKGFDSGFTERSIAAMTDIFGQDQVDEPNKQIVINSGVYEFSKSITLPVEWEMIVKPGAMINFKNGSLLKLQGPLFVQGTESNPVRVNVESSLDYKDIGSWGGIFVSSANKRSSISHMILEGTGTQNLANRQGYYGMTGCMSFYGSDVTISRSQFNNAQCEDALNIVKSDFILDNIIISAARADAFDSDFSTGLVRKSIFKNSGNDGIDVSGTKLELDRLTMMDIGDKAISVGEKSTLHAKNIDIIGAVLGVASKDLSDATIEDIRFENISGTALMTYIKKREYGPSSIDCRKCEFERGTVISGRQGGTRIIVNGRESRDGFLTKQQMIDSGLVEGASAL